MPQKYILAVQREAKNPRQSSFNTMIQHKTIRLTLRQDLMQPSSKCGLFSPEWRGIRIIAVSEEFKELLPLRQRVLCYKAMGFKANLRYNSWYISLPYSAKQQREMTKFKALWRTCTHDGESLIICLNVKAVPINNVPGCSDTLYKFNEWE